MNGCEMIKCPDYKNGLCANQLDYVDKYTGEDMCPRVYGDAWVSGNAWVYGDAEVSNNARVFDPDAIPRAEYEEY